MMLAYTNTYTTYINVSLICSTQKTIHNMLRLSEIAEREEVEDEEEKGRNNTSIWRGTRKEYP